MSLARPRATDALDRERERFLAAIVESAEDAIFAKALDGTIMSWNAAAERMYGYAPDEIIGSTVLRLAPPDRHAEIGEILRQLARGEPVQNFETERVRRNGERFPVSLAISPVRAASGEIVGASTIARDISNERRMAQAVAFERSMLEAQSEASLDGIVVLDLDRRVVFSNSRFAELWRLDPQVVRAGSWDPVLDGMARLVADAGSFAAPMRDARHGPAEPMRDTVRLLDGRVVDRYGAPVLGAGGRHAGRVWSFRDITAETIRVAQLRAVIAAMGDAALVFGPDGRVLLRNPSAAEWLPDLEHQGDLRALMESPSPESGATVDHASGVETVIETRAGPRRAIVSIQPVTDPARHAGDAPAAGAPLLGWLGIVRDVTELREIQASREAFLGVLSHELRTPITMIYGGAKMLLRADLQVAPAVLLRDIEAEADRLYRLVEDLLVLTRIEHETLHLADQPMLIGPIVERVMAAERAREPEAMLRVRLAENLPMVRGEDTYVEQIVRNLVSNALKYGPPSGPVDVIVEAGGKGVIVRVLDEGAGIAEAEADRVFELLYRSPATAAQAAGSGIGLFVGRRLAQAMGGAISARRRPDRGSEFRLELAEYHEPPDL